MASDRSGAAYRSVVLLAATAVILVVQVVLFRLVAGLPSGTAGNDCAYVTRDWHLALASASPGVLVGVAGITLGTVFLVQGVGHRSVAAAAVVIASLSICVAAATVFVGGMSGICDF